MLSVMVLRLVIQNIFHTDKSLKTTNFYKPEGLYFLKGVGDGPEEHLYSFQCLVIRESCFSLF